ncbi:uncharacterized protein MICPUCDRAFT_51535 [Micromonas pusilla CCMP1545]|uniref:Predicted protein n=1 Tax=Micromonas pusilla (strain CCMP1545) TaxID=564608 RepID=C1N2I0_MICPC|nr:uncharacterized protein MICPUCDRAFT_51535 [Micromonas pusilla CCMP1545]EEH53805.1 predicted protein [Micromonas pusilla CCMP1545]|eukprot:XP_003062093.1 predicted protein [Micromonas pusilla CCMP1545]
MPPAPSAPAVAAEDDDRGGGGGCECHCVETCAVGVVLARFGCAPSAMGSAFAFYPPNPPTYGVHDGVGFAHGRKVATYDDPRVQRAWGGVFNAFEVDLVRRASSSKGSDEDEMANVAVVSRGVAPDARCVLILAHGNALDLGTAAPFALEMHDALDVGVVAFDYTGYGPNVRGDASGWAGSDDGDVDATEKRARASAAKWKPSIEAAKADLIAVVDWVVTARRVRPERVVVVGQSVGSGPAVAYAAAAAGEKKRQKGSGAFYLTLVPIRPRWREGRYRHHPIGGLVLVSPLLSGLRVIAPYGGWCAPHQVCAPCDVFRNDRLASEIACPTLVVHGERDETIAASHGRGLHARLVGSAVNDDFAAPLWVPTAGHDDVVDLDRSSAFVARVRGFVDAVARRANRKSDGGGGGGGKGKGTEEQMTAVAPSRQRMAKPTPPAPRRDGGLLPAYLSAHPPLSIPTLGAFQRHLTPLNSTPTFACMERPGGAPVRVAPAPPDASA